MLSDEKVKLMKSVELSSEAQSEDSVLLFAPLAPMYLFSCSFTLKLRKLPDFMKRPVIISQITL